MHTIQKDPEISLIGAGPGAGDLITIRGYRTLMQADVVLYDALVASSLIKEIPEETKKIYVGKRAGKHSKSQDEINSLMVEMAFEHGHVVRLKGGDPFVFGRAAEELDYAASFGIPVAVIPGVSSITAVPGSQGIPLTKRGVNNSFWVLTATTKSGGYTSDLELAARSEATLVILMGVRKVREIAALIKRFRPGSTPIALIQNGTLPDERRTLSTLEEAGNDFSNTDHTMPGIILVGEVVNHQDLYEEEELQRLIHHTL